jgi:L-phenylalanine/L-methionine N-acetyltransferase
LDNTGYLPNSINESDCILKYKEQDGIEFLVKIKDICFLKNAAMTRIAGFTDFSFIYGLYMHPQVNPFLLYEFMDEESFRPIFDGLIQQGVKYIYSNDIESIGMFKLIPLQHRTDHIAYLGGLAVHPAFSGKGEGLKMIKEIIELAGHRGLLRIELSVSVTNEKAIQLYKKAGFEKEGVLRKYTHLKRENRFVDEILMSFIF